MSVKNNKNSRWQVKKKALVLLSFQDNQKQHNCIHLFLLIPLNFSHSANSGNRRSINKLFFVLYTTQGPERESLKLSVRRFLQNSRRHSVRRTWRRHQAYHIDHRRAGLSGWHRDTASLLGQGAHTHTQKEHISDMYLASEDKKVSTYC